MKPKYYVGIFEGHFDPAVAVVRDGEVIAFNEEERLTRNKHAAHAYPVRALEKTLKDVGIGPEDVAAICVNWDAEAYGDGRIGTFFQSLRDRYDVDAATVAWQDRLLGKFNPEALEKLHHKAWRTIWGDIRLPPVRTVPHHWTHAFQAYAQSPYDSAIALTVDGSGDTHCTVVWKCEGQEITPLKEIPMPHSLGWLYAAFTEYLGFEAYDGEYKVMGLAAFGEADPTLRDKLREIVSLGENGEYSVDPSFIHYGPHTYSDRYTDRLADLFGRPPRLREEPIEAWHKNLAFEVQALLEETMIALVRWAQAETGFDRLVVGGGVGLNVKMNTRLFDMPEITNIFPHPLCSDSGAAAGAALAVCWQEDGVWPEPLGSLALGVSESNNEIEAVLEKTKLNYTRSEDVAADVAKALADGKIVGWVQGKMEAGPRALGHRSILADPRSEGARDKVNEVIKYRELWRPFCPSMQAEAAADYFDSYDDAPYMIIAFEANQRLKDEAPAIVHIDGTSRVQMVHSETSARYHDLIGKFAELTGVPVLLNTSFNVKGEPIVCTALDAVRTFCGTGLDVLAVGDFILRKDDLSRT
ncbi:nodulation protein [Pseudooceanicola batsensis HTCC2597]|uniref:Nodulation protein n=1 Tax=Pseudooceanicola batsensis (strain ATCC BAA-863 / DSM 15984 / KCTC 12145 / HTCC2597) TaxID=252305 RepID=A3TU92_PSEBH|nr:carbamoyltransferase C-terminal domain-containing protein [Pseudooceanicola batsensis]EAQ04088.1 nodulation protein [Pseudooceanicola batsensis HTCC2597]